MTKLTEAKIREHLKTNSLLDITKYFYNSHSVTLPTDYRTLGEIFHNRNSNTFKRTYNDEYLDFIKQTSCILVNSSNMDISLSAVQNMFKRHKSGSKQYIMPTDLDLAYSLHWSDDSDDEIDTTKEAVRSDAGLPEIAYNAAIKCFQQNKPVYYLKELIRQDDMVARLEDNLRLKIWNKYDRIYSLLFIDRVGLTRFIKDFCNKIGKKLIKAYAVAPVEVIFINNFNETETNETGATDPKFFETGAAETNKDEYILCLIDALRIGAHQPCKLIALIKTNFFEEAENYKIFHFEEEKIKKFFYFSAAENDFLLIKTPSESVVISLPAAENLKKWVEKWFNVEVSHELPAEYIEVIKSLPNTNRMMTCTLPISLSEITLTSDNNQLDEWDNDKLTRKAIDMIKSSLAHPTNAILPKTPCNNIYTHLEIDAELFNLLNNETDKYKINGIRNDY